MEAVGTFLGYVIFYLIFALIFACVYLIEIFAYLSLPVCLVCFIAALLLHYFCHDHLQWHWYLPFVATCIAILWALSCGAALPAAACCFPSVWGYCLDDGRIDGAGRNS